MSSYHDEKKKSEFALTATAEASVPDVVTIIGEGRTILVDADTHSCGETPIFHLRAACDSDDGANIVPDAVTCHPRGGLQNFLARLDAHSYTVDGPSLLTYGLIFPDDSVRIFCRLYAAVSSIASQMDATSCDTANTARDAVRDIATVYYDVFNFVAAKSTLADAAKAASEIVCTFNTRLFIIHGTSTMDIVTCRAAVNAARDVVRDTATVFYEVFNVVAAKSTPADAAKVATKIADVFSTPFSVILRTSTTTDIWWAPADATRGVVKAFLAVYHGVFDTVSDQITHDNVSRADHDVFNGTVVVFPPVFSDVVEAKATLRDAAMAAFDAVKESCQVYHFVFSAALHARATVEDAAKAAHHALDALATAYRGVFNDIRAQTTSTAAAGAAATTFSTLGMAYWTVFSTMVKTQVNPVDATTATLVATEAMNAVSGAYIRAYYNAYATALDAGAAANDAVEVATAAAKSLYYAYTRFFMTSNGARMPINDAAIGASGTALATSQCYCKIYRDFSETGAGVATAVATAVAWVYVRAYTGIYKNDPNTTCASFAAQAAANIARAAYVAALGLGKNERDACSAACSAVGPHFISFCATLFGVCDLVEDVLVLVASYICSPLLHGPYT